jgi:hypothetical protein
VRAQQHVEGGALSIVTRNECQVGRGDVPLAIPLRTFGDRTRLLHRSQANTRLELSD